MDVNRDSQEGLHLCGDSVHIPDKVFKKLVESTLAILLKQENEDLLQDKIFTNLNDGILKEAYYGLVTLITEATKTDCNVTDISTFLEECKWDTDRITFFNKVYDDFKTSLQKVLGSTKTVFPHIVDVDWRLDFYVKNKFLDKVNKPTYLISLKTDDGKVDGKVSDVLFSCSMEQLQDLVGKLKDACKSVEKAAQS